MMSSRLLLPHNNPFSPLKAASIQPRTIQSYDDNLKKFLTFTRLTLSKLMRLPAHRIDLLLSSYFDWSFSLGGSYTYATYALNGLCFHYPLLKGQLPESKRRLKGWDNLRVSRSYPPITWELTTLLAVTLARSGFYAEGIALLLSFDCYLRVGELVGLRFRDIARPNDPRLGSVHRHMAMRLRKTKTGRNQWVSLKNPQVAVVFWQYLQSRTFGDMDSVFPFSASHLRRALHGAVDSLGLSHIPYVLHSLRHGGATSDFLAGSTIEQIKFRGRWKSMESVARYIQTGRALLLTLQVPSTLNDAGYLYSEFLVDVMSFILKR